VLSFFFGAGNLTFIQSFYFVCMLLPVAVLTSWLFNDILVPKFLLKKRYGKFTLYLVYVLVISLWLQMLVVIGALILIGNYDVNNLGPLIGNVQILTVIIYLVVFIQAFIHLLFNLQKERNKSSEKISDPTIVFRIDRRNHPVNLKDILYIESRSDYIEIQTTGDRLVTRERISKLSERLPSEFIRVHRSFLVNRKHITVFTMEEITIGDHTIPVGRKFRVNMEKLKENEPGSNV
ncbi:MAG: LytTR family DNA-binding domain-containing protein, partial [Cyclobacteriaceae bacterium]